MSNPLSRFLVRGLRDADERLAAFLQPARYDKADSYLAQSGTVRTFNSFTRVLERWWRASVTRQALTATMDEWRQQGWRSRYEALGLALLMAVTVHVGFTLIEGPRPGWFWLLIPALTAGFALVLLAASRASRSDP